MEKIHKVNELRCGIFTFFIYNEWQACGVFYETQGLFMAVTGSWKL